MKLFRLKAEGVQKARLAHFGGNRADSSTKHGFPINGIFDKMNLIHVFPNPAFGGTFSLTTCVVAFFYMFPYEAQKYLAP